jgi:hypothetical protein
MLRPESNDFLKPNTKKGIQSFFALLEPKSLVKALFKEKAVMLKTFKRGLIDISKVYYSMRGIPNKTFPKSDLIKEMKIIKKPEGLFIESNDYIRYLDSGRKKRARKVPIDVLITWMKKNDIKPSGKNETLTSVAFKIQNAIYKNGILGRDFIDPSLEVTVDVLIVEAFKIYQKEFNRL